MVWKDSCLGLKVMAQKLQDKAFGWLFNLSA